MPGPSEQSVAAGELRRVYADLMSDSDVAVRELPDNEDWSGLIQRISVPGQINEITEETYFYFLEVLPPRLFNGNQFCFAEGSEPLRLFWRRKGRHFCRQLTWDETRHVCDASGLPREYE
jgi:hypothetical protein